MKTEIFIEKTTTVQKPVAIYTYETLIGMVKENIVIKFVRRRLFTIRITYEVPKLYLACVAD